MMSSFELINSGRKGIKVEEEMDIGEEFIPENLINSPSADDNVYDVDTKPEVEIDLDPFTTLDTVDNEIEQNKLIFDLLQCDGTCEMCIKYIKILREHVKASHVSSQVQQSIQDPLYIEPTYSDSDPLSSIQIKCDVENQNNTEDNYSVNFNFDPYVEVESGSESMPESFQISTPKWNSKKGKKDSATGEENPFMCDVCPKSFKKLHNLTFHKRTHVQNKPYKCNECEKSYSRFRDLETHKRRHTGERPFKCDICAQGFTRQSYMNVHRKKHTGEYPHKCTMCEKGFSCSSNLIRHIRVHTGERPYGCDECSLVFNSSPHLSWHKKRQHT